MALTIGVHEDIDGLSKTDGIAHLHKHLVGNAGSHHVFSNIASSICRRAVHLRRVLTREGTTAVSPFSTIGVDNNLATRQTCVAMRSANDELSSWIDVINDVVVEEGERLLVALLFHTGDENLLHVTLDLLQHGFVVVHEFIVLSRNHNRMNALRNTVIAILDGYLTLRVGT